MTAELVVRVHHEPATQGSFFAQCTVDKKHRAIAIPDNKATKSWRKAIVDAVKSAMTAAGWLTLGPDDAVAIEITFWLERPKTVRRPYPSTRPDIDKLARSSLDGLADAHVLSEDGRVVDLTVRKRYCENGRPPGATIRVRAISEQASLL